MASYFGHVDDGLVHIDCWLAVHPGDKRNFNRRPTVKLTAGEPSLSRYERAINLKLTLPLALFETPAIVARVSVTDVAQPVTIDRSAVAEAIKSVIGLDVDIAVADARE